MSFVTVTQHPDSTPGTQQIHLFLAHSGAITSAVPNLMPGAGGQATRTLTRAGRIRCCPQIATNVPNTNRQVQQRPIHMWMPEQDEDTSMPADQQTHPMHPLRVPSPTTSFAHALAPPCISHRSNIDVQRPCARHAIECPTARADISRAGGHHVPEMLSHRLRCEFS